MGFRSGWDLGLGGISSGSEQGKNGEQGGGAKNYSYMPGIYPVC